MLSTDDSHEIALLLVEHLCIKLICTRIFDMPIKYLSHSYHSQSNSAPRAILRREPRQRLFGPCHRLEHFSFLTYQECLEREYLGQLRGVIRIAPFLFRYLKQVIYTLFSIWNTRFFHQYKEERHRVVQTKVRVAFQLFFW